MRALGDKSRGVIEAEKLDHFSQAEAIITKRS